MNFLQLCQRVHLLARIGEDRPGTAPATVTGQTGALAEIVAWVQMAYDDIQRSKTHWKFLAGVGTLGLTPDEVEHDPLASGIDDFKLLIGSMAEDTRTFVGIYTVNTADETPCYYVPYEQWVLGYYDRHTDPSGRPAFFTITPEGNFAFHPKPDIAYNVRVFYRKEFGALAANADEPLIPEEYHMAIVWKVIADYYCGTRENTRELRTTAKERLREVMYALHRDQLPDFTVD